MRCTRCGSDRITEMTLHMDVCKRYMCRDCGYEVPDTEGKEDTETKKELKELRRKLKEPLGDTGAGE